MHADVVLWAVIGYGAGALPSAYLLAVATGHEDAARKVERTVGEADAHVVLRESGAGRAAALAGFMDVIKAFVPVLLAGHTTSPYAAAACGIGAVAGHCWPPVYRRFAGRGLSAAAGAFLGLLPVEMFLGGSITGIGLLAKVGGIASTVGFVSVPVAAGLRHQPFSYLLMAWTIIALIVLRRLEGLTADVARGVHPARAFVRRAFFDVSRGKPRATTSE